MDPKISQSLIVVSSAAIAGIAVNLCIERTLNNSIDYDTLTFVVCLLTAIMAIFTVVVFLIENNQMMKISFYVTIVLVITWIVFLVIYAVRSIKYNNL